MLSWVEGLWVAWASSLGSCGGVNVLRRALHQVIDLYFNRADGQLVIAIHKGTVREEVFINEWSGSCIHNVCRCGRRCRRWRLICMAPRRQPPLSDGTNCRCRAYADAADECSSMWIQCGRNRGQREHRCVALWLWQLVCGRRAGRARECVPIRWCYPGGCEFTAVPDVGSVVLGTTTGSPAGPARPGGGVTGAAYAKSRTSGGEARGYYYMVWP